MTANDESLYMPYAKEIRNVDEGMEDVELRRDRQCMAAFMEELPATLKCRDGLLATALLRNEKEGYVVMLLA